ncbi:MAG: hypothetical protein KGL18_16995 [Burkholderiales bacterium]|nr:hypothetical protein [Burkholderiales bacterium]MDE1926198.1 hypothetical protein [Burkholderiales bacterium]MDE2158747.1 hypothetical protein [Burkholderiales bacterium]MDE2504664.1 hypothetical protein [Burkholderiales bacterium]
MLFAVAGASKAAAVGEQDVLAPCKAVAAHVESAAMASRPAQGRRAVDYDALLAPVIAVPPPRLADPDLYARALRWLGSDHGPVVEVQHVDGPVWRSLQVLGTADCTYEKFFRVQADGALETVDTPASYADLCWNSTRDIGKVSGRPALIEREFLEHPALGLDVEITPWTNDAALATCRVSIRFDDAFRVSERFCRDASICRDAEPLAPRLAEAYARAAGAKVMENVSPAPPERRRAYAAQFLDAEANINGDHRGYTVLPTFGSPPRTPYPIYGGSPQMEVIDVDGRTLIVRVGVGGVGWRELGDYLITLYQGDRGAEQGLAPVASFVVERRPTGLPTVTTSVPRPYVNTH